MLSWRRRSMDYFSPCHSSNKKRPDHHRHPHYGSLGWPAVAFATESEEETDNRSWTQSRISDSTRSRPSSELLAAMAAMAGGRRRGSSFGSCGGWSLGSFLDKCPTTPSPICSPASFLSCSPPSEHAATSHVCTANDSSFATPNQSSSITSNDGKKSASTEQVEERRRRKPSSSPQQRQEPVVTPSPMKRSTREGSGSATKRSRTPKSNPTSTPMRSAGRHVSCQVFESVEPGGCRNVNDDGRLPAVIEEREERGSHRPTRLFSDDGYYRVSSDEVCGGYENFDMESAINESIRSAAQRKRRMKKREIEAKLIAWKEASTTKLMNQLRKEEAVINEWERKLIGKAKMEMRAVEMRLDKQRAKAMDRMQRRIRSAQAKAQEKKVKEQAAAAKKMSVVAKSFEKARARGTAGKLSCGLFFH